MLHRSRHVSRSDSLGPHIASGTELSFTNACRMNQMDGWVDGQMRVVERLDGLAARTSD